MRRYCALNEVRCRVSLRTTIAALAVSLAAPRREAGWRLAQERAVKLVLLTKAIEDARLHLRAAVLSLPVLDANRDAHFELEHARIGLSRALRDVNSNPPQADAEASRP